MYIYMREREREHLILAFRDVFWGAACVEWILVFRYFQLPTVIDICIYIYMCV